MKTILRILGAGATFALAGSPFLLAQQEPVLAVDITRIAVLSGSGSIISTTVVSGGSGYTNPPAVTVSGGGGSGAILEANISGGVVTSLTIVDPGTGYTSLPTITIAPPGTTATATATATAGQVQNTIQVTNGGSGYTTPPAVTVSGVTGSGAVAVATISGGAVTNIAVTNGGSGYPNSPTVTIAPPGATASATPNGLGTVFQTPFQNESYGPVNVPITITAQARGTFPVGGFTYTFFVNGQMLGQSVNTQPPGGGEGRISWAPPQPGAYLLTVRASDGAHTVTSLAVRYFATGTAIIGPVDNTLVPNGSSVVLQATATPTPSGSDAFVQRMEFYIDGALVGTDTTYPYSFIYTPATTPTTHVIEARGFDNNGNQISPDGTATRRLHMVTPIGTPPIVRIVNPPTGGSVAAGTSVNIIADAISPGGFIKNVDFYLNGVQLSSTQTFPFTASWTPQVPGKYEFVAIGFDDKSNAVASAPISITVTGAFPTASIINPATSGMTVVQGSILPVTVRAAGPDGGIASLKKIEFLVDGVVSDSLPKASTGTGGTGTGGTGAGGAGTTATGGTADTTTNGLKEPFVFDWKSNVPVGTHRLSARVTGINDLSITSQEITVNVVPNQPPQVSITSPTASSSAAVNSGTTIVAAPTDVDGTIASVEFFANGVSIGSATKAPFQVSWTPTNAGTVALTAKATDNGGASATSAGVSITVDPASSGPTIANTVYRGDYGGISESGRFAFGVSRNNRATLIAFSTAPAGKSYLWTDIPLNNDGSFSLRDANNQLVLNGQTSATGVSGTFGDKTFIGPITPTTGTFTPLLLNGSLTGVPNSQVVAIVGGDGSITLHAASGNGREAGADFLSPSGTYSFTAPTGGRFTGTVANTASMVSGSSTGTAAGAFLLRQQASRISNISTRTLAGSGDRTLVAGFVVTGSGTKPLLVRAVGPTLANFGVPNTLADPNLSVLTRTSALVGVNDDWANSAALATLASQVGAFPLTSGSRDAALQVSVAPGTYTAVVGGAGSQSGAALVEIYDTENAGTVTARITNISTRGQIGAGDELIAGFVIAGDTRKKLLIRAVGPTLSSFGLSGVLADPRITVLSGSTAIATNNDWTEDAVANQATTTASMVGAFPLASGSKDAALVLQLNPGSYTVQVSGAAGASGTVLIEIYDADL